MEIFKHVLGVHVWILGMTQFSWWLAHEEIMPIPMLIVLSFISTLLGLGSWIEDKKGKKKWERRKQL